MAAPSLARLDLNLLVALDALLRERSVTRAAEHLGLSQPALSASLSRLRVHFGDDILARQGNTYQLTPLAMRLSEQTVIALDSAKRVFATQAIWNPSESTREFTIYGSDYAFVTVGPVAADLAAERAPGIRFRFVQHSVQVVDEALSHLRVADGLIMPHGYLNDLPYLDLWSDDWVVLASADNDDVGEALTLDDVATMPWVLTYRGPNAFTSADKQMQQLGIEPKVECVVEGFLNLPFFVAGTKRLGLIQSRLAPYALQNPGIRVLSCPFEATPLVDALWWHPMHNHDPEHIWMRELLREAARAQDVAA